MTHRHASDGDEPFDAGDLDAKMCPTCGRDLPAWHADCPVCREPAVLRFGLAGPALPAVPDHLRDAVEEPAADGAGQGQRAETGAHKPDADLLHDPTLDAADLTPVIAPLWAAGGPGVVGGGDGGC